MKIPKWARQPRQQYTVKDIAIILEIEAKAYRQAGRKDAADALRQVAARLREINITVSPAACFGWPSDAASQPQQEPK